MDSCILFFSFALFFWKLPVTYKHDMGGLQQCLKDCLSKDNSVDTILKLLIAANGINELGE